VLRVGRLSVVTRQFGSVSVASALPDARPLANELRGLARHTRLTTAPRDSADLLSFNRTAALRLLHLTWLGTPSKPCNTAPLNRHYVFLWQALMVRMAKLSLIRSHSL
jgi:hypothetical protein